MNRLVIGFLVALAMSILPSVGEGQNGCGIDVWDPVFCRLCCPESQAFANSGCLLACPGGDGATLGSIGSTIFVTLIDENGPVAGISPDIICVGRGSPGSNFTYCSRDPSQWLIADSPTNSQGQTTISGRAVGGGWTDGLCISVVGIAMPDFTRGCIGAYVLPIKVRSPDINGDLQVNLSDLTLFSYGYPPNAYDTRCDMNCDGAVNLVDLSIFALHYGPPGHHCQ